MKRKEDAQAEAGSPARPAEAPTYSRDELIDAASSFGAKPEVVAGALRLAGLDRATRAQAEAAIRRFLRREV